MIHARRSLIPFSEAKTWAYNRGSAKKYFMVPPDAVVECEVTGEGWMLRMEHESFPIYVGWDVVPLEIWDSLHK